MNTHTWHFASGARPAYTGHYRLNSQSGVMKFYKSRGFAVEREAPLPLIVIPFGLITTIFINPTVCPTNAIGFGSLNGSQGQKANLDTKAS